MKTPNKNTGAYVLLAAFIATGGAGLYILINSSSTSGAPGLSSVKSNGAPSGATMGKLPSSLDMVKTEQDRLHSQGDRLFKGKKSEIPFGHASTAAPGAAGNEALGEKKSDASGQNTYFSGKSPSDSGTGEPEDAASHQHSAHSHGAPSRSDRSSSSGRSSAHVPGGAHDGSSGGEGAGTSMSRAEKSPSGSEIEEPSQSGGDLTVTRDDGSQGSLHGTFFADAPAREIPKGAKAIVTVLKTKNAGGGAKTVYFSDDSVITFPPGTAGNKLNACDQAVFTAQAVAPGMKNPVGKELVVASAIKSGEGSMVTFSDGSQISYTPDMSGHTLKEGQSVVQVPEPYGKFVTVVSNRAVSKDKALVTFSDGTQIAYGEDEFGYRYGQNDHAILMPPKNDEEAAYYPGTKGVTVAKTLKDGDGNRVTFSDGTEMYYTSAEPGYEYGKGQPAKLIADPHCKVVAVTKSQMTEAGNLVTFSDGTQIYYAPDRQGYSYRPGSNVVIDRNGHQVPIDEGGHEHPAPGAVAGMGHAHH